jgi:predicted glutamine amidotransferase
VVTQPLTTNEAWVAFEPGRVYTFEDGDWVR